MKNGKKFFFIFPLLLVVAVGLIITGRARGAWTSDLTPPTLSTSPVLSTTLASPTLLPAPIAPATTTITLNCSDTGSGCASVYYNVAFYSDSGYSKGYSGNSPTPTAAPTTTNISINISDIANNPYVKISATATDGAGNKTSASYYFVFGHNITGTVYYDSDHDYNGPSNPGSADSNYTGIFNVTANTASCTVSNNTYACNDLPPGTYTITISLSGQASPPYVPSYFNLTGGASGSCLTSPPYSSSCNTSITIGGDQALNFYATKIYSISGNVFDDVNKNHIRDFPPDTNYLGGATITISFSPGGTQAAPNTTSYTTDGDYTFGDLISGAYTVSIIVPTTPVQYIKTYPLPGVDYTADVGDGVDVGYGCALNPYSPDPTYAPPNMCSSADSPSGAKGSLSGVDFGISDSIVWEQCVGADCWLSGGDTIPPNAKNPTTCSAGAYAIGTNTTSTSPGVYYGETPTTPPGSAISSTNWIANSYNFTPVSPGVIRTSYSYMQTTLSQAGITAIPLTTACNNSGGCSLSTLTHGVYKNDTSQNNNNPTPFYLNTTTFSANSNYVFLINGDLNILGNILVPNGSTATFYVSGNIIVAPTVGETTPAVCKPSTTAGGTSTGCNIEGFYSADNQFIIQGTNNCASATKDLQLNIAGSVVVNASDNSSNPSTIVNNRDLCANDQYCPTYSITERPDMVLNAPELIEHPNYVWQEVAP